MAERLGLFELMEIDLPELYSQEDNPNPDVIAHFSNGDWDWYVIEGRKEGDDGDYLLFGLVDGFDLELGYFTLGQILGVGAMLNSGWKAKSLNDLKAELGG